MSGSPMAKRAQATCSTLPRAGSPLARRDSHRHPGVCIAPIRQLLLNGYLPPIIPVIVHHSETGWTAPTHFQGLFDSTTMADADLQRRTPEFEVQLDDISHCSDEELRARAIGPAATLAFLFLRDSRREGRILAELLSWADLFHAVLAAPNGQRAILQLFS